MNQNIKLFLIIVLGTLFIYLGALVAFDFNLNEIKIPITGQSLAVLVVGIASFCKWSTWDRSFHKRKWWFSLWIFILSLFNRNDE